MRCLDDEMPRGGMPQSEDALQFFRVVRYEAEEAGGPVGDSSCTKLRRRASEVRCSRLISGARSFVQVRGVEVLLDRGREFRRLGSGLNRGVNQTFREGNVVISV